MQNTATKIAAQLDNASVTFANICYTTQVKTAAAHKAVNIKKSVIANVQLFSNIKQATTVFANAVKKSATRLDSTDAAAIAQFTQQSNYYEHTDCYSIVKHKKSNKLYLYCIYNNTQSVQYTIDGEAATKQQVAEYLTPSAAKKLLQPSNTVVNKTHNIEHDVTVRTIALDNLQSITCNKQTVTF